MLYGSCTQMLAASPVRSEYFRRSGRLKLESDMDVDPHSLEEVRGPLKCEAGSPSDLHCKQTVLRSLLRRGVWSE